MNEIGGYFGLEIKKYNNFPLTGGLYLNSGRSALGYLLKSFDEVSTIYIPYFTCSVILQPINALNIKYKFYSINDKLEIVDNIILKKNDLILYTNYFGIKSSYVNELIKVYGRRLIVDNAQALFDEPNESTSTFYSPRKFIGIPDGGIVYSVNKFKESSFEQDFSYERCSHLLMRLDKNAEFGYANFKMNSLIFDNCFILEMSQLTKTLISAIDFEFIQKKRRENFKYLHEKLQNKNKLEINPEKIACPMIYPYRTTLKSLREKLLDNKIYIPTYWSNVLKWCKETDSEFQLTQTIIPLPIDQRYNLEDMERIFSIIMSTR